MARGTFLPRQRHVAFAERVQGAVVGAQEQAAGGVDVLGEAGERGVAATDGDAPPERVERLAPACDERGGVGAAIAGVEAAEERVARQAQGGRGPGRGGGAACGAGRAGVRAGGKDRVEFLRESGGHYPNTQAVGGKRYLAALQCEGIVAIDIAPPAGQCPDIRVFFGCNAVQLSAVCY